MYRISSEPCSRPWAFVLLAGVLTSLAGAGHADGQGRPDTQEAPGSIIRVERLGADEGWVLTDRVLLVTRDGGMTWSDLTGEQSLEGVTDAWLLSQERAWLVATSSMTPSRLVVLETADGGVSWLERVVASSDLGTGRAFVRAGIRFLDDDHGWLLGQVATSSAFSVGELLRTTDGGKSWVRLPHPPAAGRFIFKDAFHGYMTDGPVSERLYRTVDGGWSWREVDVPVAVERGKALYSLPIFRSQEKGAVAITIRDEEPRVITLATHDGGASWLPADSMALPPGSYDEAVPVAVGESGEILAVAVRGTVAFLSGAVLSEHPLTPRMSGDSSRRGSESVSARELALADDGSAWALAAEGGCDRGSCRQVSWLVSLKPGDESARDLLVRIRELLRPEKKKRAVAKAGVISFAHGFDKCAAGTAEEMQTWWDDSPHEIANIYFGGAARACSQVNLDAEWVAEVFEQGWRLIPTWVGPQAPCTNFIRRISADPVEARADGVAEADAAVSAAVALGLGEGTPLYYDVEYYDEFDQSCSAAMREFIDGWSERVQDHGYLAGAYGNARNVQNDWIPGVVANPLQAVWLVPWVCGRTSSCDWPPSVFGVPGLDDAYWADYQRIRQYWGPHTETYGGVTFEIDSDYANGPVAAEGASASCWQIVPSDRWQGEYFDNTDFDGDPVMVRDDGGAALDFGWGEGSPSSDCGVPSDQFSVRWTRILSFKGGTYRFTVTADDGLRLSIDGVVEIDEWRRQGPTTFTVTVELAAGDHTLQLEYFEGGGGATAELSWEPLSHSRRARGRRIPS